MGRNSWQLHPAVGISDSDCSYDFGSLMPFLEKLREGAALVVGNRFSRGIRPGAMPWLHKHIGNPLLSKIGRLFFRSPCHDFYCGLRAVRRDAVATIDLRSIGVGLGLIVVGLVGSLFAVQSWGLNEFGDLDPFRGMRIVIPSVLALILGSQTAFFSFYLSLRTTPGHTRPTATERWPPCRFQAHRSEQD